MKETRYVKKGEVPKKWHLIDAEGQRVGRLSSTVASLLRGKHKAQYTPNSDLGDYVVIINAEKIELTGQKELTKIYFSHSGYLGHLKETTAAEMRIKKPTLILEKAIKGMLPKNKLNRKIFEKLFIYEGPQHKHQGQKPEPYSL